MSERKKVCEQCGYQVDAKDVYCAFCGSNLQIRTKTASIVTPSEDITIDSGEIKTDLLSSYYELTDQLKNYKHIEDDLYRQNVYYSNLLKEVNNAKNFYERRRYQTDLELKDVEKLRKVSWTSIKARIKGDKEELLKKEEIEHMAAVSREEAAKKDMEELNKRLEIAEKELNELKQLNEQESRLEQQLIKLVDAACEGVADPIEDRVEQELKSLYLQRKPLFDKKNQANAALGHIQNSRTHYERAFNSLGSAKGLANWDTFFGGGLFVDSMKHSRVADARNSVQQAQRALERAYNLEPNMPGVKTALVEESSFFWDAFMDNIFSDLNARDRIMRSRRSVEDAYASTDGLLNWISSKIQGIDQEFNQLEKKIKAKRKELTRERQRMVEEALNK